MILTSVFEKNIVAFNSGVRRIVNQGGTSSSKTYSILQLLILIAQKSKTPLLISIVSETLPHLKKGAMRDFENILRAEGWYDEQKHNKTDRVYYIGISQIEFFSAEDSGKVRGPRRDILYMNECNNLSKEIYDELEVRTNKTIFLDYNPVQHFWVHDHVLTLPASEVAYIESTYLNNDALPESIRKSIESRKETDADWWRVYGLGKTGRIEGLVFPDWVLIEKMPEIDSLGDGLDFGFTNDPSALVNVSQTEANIYFDELLYEYALTAPMLSQQFHLLNRGRLEIIADSSRPDTITELSRYGWNIHACIKGPGSVVFGIDTIKRRKIHVTKRSVNLIKELRNYKWKKDSQGKIINEPVDIWNHAIDAARYRTAFSVGNPKLRAAKFNFD